MQMMTRRAKSRAFCCPGHNPAQLDHGTSRTREKTQWRREALVELADYTAEPTGRGGRRA